MAYYRPNGQRAAKVRDWKGFQKAQMEDLYAVGTRNPAMGGAEDHAMSMNRKKFGESAMGRYLHNKGGNAFEDAFKKKYYGGFTSKYYGQIDDDAFNQYMRMNGIMPPGVGGGQRRTTKKATNQPLGGLAGTTGAGGNSMLDQYMAGVGEQNDDANYANLARYRQVLDSKNNLMGQVEQRLEGWGDTQHAMNEELMGERLRDVNAGLSSRGLGNTTRGGAFEERNARDLGFLQQALAEKVDERAVNYMTSLTGDRDAFVERRTDEAPSESEAMKMALLFGEAGNGQRVASATAPPATSVTTQPGERQGNSLYSSAWGTPQAAGNVYSGQGLFPAADAINQAMLGGGGQRAQAAPARQEAAPVGNAVAGVADDRFNDSPQVNLIRLQAMDTTGMSKTQKNRLASAIRQAKKAARRSNVSWG